MPSWRTCLLTLQNLPPRLPRLLMDMKIVGSGSAVFMMTRRRQSQNPLRQLSHTKGMRSNMHMTNAYLRLQMQLAKVCCFLQVHPKNHSDVSQSLPKFHP